MQRTLARLQEWFALHCNGDWEHSCGVTINTLDNPGWSVRVALRDTELENVPFEPVRIDYDHPLNWVTCFVKDDQFHGACGRKHLEKVLEVFLEWADKHKPPTA